jgi:hypothetical protein
MKALARRRRRDRLSPNRNMTKRGAATTLEEFGDMVGVGGRAHRRGRVAIGTDYCPGHDRRGTPVVALGAMVAREGARRSR